ncbi:MAG TPA: prepilin peptidase [Firmicutes bacterium]|nr:prepilin peptidase [Candidatus Fermentithermobacillaceae bacterium]
MHLALATLTGTGLCAMYDLRTGRIPNKITFSCILAGIVINTWSHGFAGMRDSLHGFAVGILLLIIPFALGGMGAGDVKMLAAVGAINGSRFVFHVFLYGAVAGGVLSAFTACKMGGYRRKMAIPYGAAIFMGTVITYLMSFGGI